MARSTIEFNAAADHQLAYIARTLDISSKAEVVRNALSLYAYLVDLMQDKPSRALGIIDEANGNRIEKVIIVPGIYPAPVPAESVPVPSQPVNDMEPVGTIR